MNVLSNAQPHTRADLAVARARISAELTPSAPEYRSGMGPLLVSREYQQVQNLGLVRAAGPAQLAD